MSSSTTNNNDVELARLICSILEKAGQGRRRRQEQWQRHQRTTTSPQPQPAQGTDSSGGGGSAGMGNHQSEEQGVDDHHSDHVDDDGKDGSSDGLAEASSSLDWWEELESWLGMNTATTATTTTTSTRTGRWQPHQQKQQQSQPNQDVLDNDDDDDDVWTVEDCLPLPELVYTYTIQFLGRAWEGLDSSLLPLPPIPEQNNLGRVVVTNPGNATTTITTTRSNMAVPSATVAAAAATAAVPLLQQPLKHTSSNPLLELTLRTSSTSNLAAVKGAASSSAAANIITLARAFPSVRATRLLRHWMEYNLTEVAVVVVGTGTGTAATTTKEAQATPAETTYTDDMDDDAAVATTTSAPTAMTSTTTTSTTILHHLLANPMAYRYIVGLFRHIQHMPMIQSNLYQYTQSLQKRQPPSDVTMATASAAQDRVLQIQKAQEMLNQLEKDWDQHVEDVYDILGQTYQYANGVQRQFIRRGLGQIWADFIHATTSATSSSSRGVGTGFMQENTRAAAIKLTLKVLHRILLGMTWSSGIQPAHEHLLFQVLIPLHRPSGMVLWRDQMAMLELYHEPLVQCMAVIMQQDPIIYIPRTIEAIIHDPDIVAPLGGGNTPKQVLLLHEIDTYLGLLPITTTTTATTKPPPEDTILMLLRPAPSDAASSTESLSRTITTARHLKNSTSSSASSSSSSSALSSWWTDLLYMLARCIASDNSRVSERALQYFQNKKFWHLLLVLESEQYSTAPISMPKVLSSSSSSSPAMTSSLSSGPRQHSHPTDGTLASLKILLPALVRAEPSWNPTVRKMTYNVLHDLETKLGENRWAYLCNQIFTVSSPSGTAATKASGSSAETITPKTSSLWSTDDANIEMQVHLPVDTSLRAGMGDWRPPTSSLSAASRRAGGGPGGGAPMPPPPSRPPPPLVGQRPQPPLAITGVAPWASAAAASRPPGARQSNPPVTITGVAPWVAQPSIPTARPGAKRPGPSTNLSLAAAMEEDEDELEVAEGEEQEGLHDDDGTSAVAARSTAGVEQVRAYMALIQPPREQDGLASWSLDQLAASPTLLPDLKFHDLVFGHELGVGAFSTVKYARQIDRAVTRSYWAEYAVKVIATDKIRELGYEASVQREIAVLSILSHPGVARLVSSFRFREGAYLVLEYASRGDLHNLIRKHGSLDHDSTRFVIGEVVAVLASIHDLGFVYGDLKPENIVITEPGHIKLTDFGGCRPVTPAAKSMVTSIAKNLLQNLRDGDWKSSDGLHGDSDRMDASEIGAVDNEEGDDDVRIEGTTAFLPPEVVLGGIPTYVADSWALGCVMYQCLSGRPPLLDVDDESTRRRIVSFEIRQGTTAGGDPVHELFSGAHAATISSEAKDLITQLLTRQPALRPRMHSIASHDFFTKADVDVFSLYQGPAHPLDVGNVSPAAADSRWTRRQFSSIWAPQPVAYNLSAANTTSGSITEYPYAAASSKQPILEGQEAVGYFSPFGNMKPTSLGNVPERPPIQRQS